MISNAKLICKLIAHIVTTSAHTFQRANENFAHKEAAASQKPWITFKYWVNILFSMWAWCKFS